MAGARLAIVIVTWNCRDLALRCLREAADSSVPGGVEFVVVDNASSDGTAEAVATSFPTALLLRSDINLGFAAACNRGIAASTAPMVLLLNPDAFPATPNVFANLVFALEQRPHFAAIGPRLVGADRSHQVGDAGYRPGPAQIAAWSIGLHRLLRGLVVAGPPRSGVQEVDWLCGAAMLVRRAALEQSGGLDERFFMYAEDVELGCRLRDAGWRIGYLGAETVLHLQGGTQASAIRIGWLDSLGLLMLARSGRRAWRRFWLLLWLGFQVRAAAYWLLRSERATAMAAFARHSWAMSGTPPPCSAAA